MFKKNMKFVSFLGFLLFACSHHDIHSKTNSTQTAKKNKNTTLIKPEDNSSPPSTSFIGLPIDIAVLAKQCYMIDYDTGAVLLEKNSTALMHPSSMTKILTAYLVIDKIKKGVINEDSVFTASKNGWRVEGSSMFLNLNDQVKVRDLLKGLIIQSGNDASVILAENISGSESAFAKEMTRKAHEIGALQTNFLNASGLPLPEHQTTAKDLAIISTHVIKDQPEFYDLYGEKEFTYANIKQGNRNPLLYKNIGCDGIKTGHSNSAGYGMVASCVQNGRRLILVINGLNSMQARATEATQLLTWGFNTFTNKIIAHSKEVMGTLPVMYGTSDQIKVIAPQKYSVTIPKINENDIKTTVQLEKTVEAPIKSGAVLGTISLTSPTHSEPITFNLVAETDIDRSGFFKRIVQRLSSIFNFN